MEEIEVYFEVQYGRKGQDIWYNSGVTKDTITGAVRYCLEHPQHKDFEYRIVRRTTTTEVVE